MSSHIHTRPHNCFHGLLPTLLLAVATGSTLFAQTTPQSRIALRPLTRDDIAANKLPSTTQVSGGLSTVGIGQPVYLDALVDKNIPPAEIAPVEWTLTRKPADSRIELEQSPLGLEVPIYEPSDGAAFQLAGRMLLRPDVAGVYMLDAKIVTAKNGTVILPLILTGGKYVGSSACTGCHAGGSRAPWSMADSWAKTAHASLFKNGVNGVASDHYGPGCIGCHTVGFDTNPNAVNGGFDDVAAALKWTVPAVKDQKPGTFEALPKELQALANIQCENCHGPGSQHIKSGGDSLQISRSMESGACGQCHGALTHHSKTGQWLSSRHAMAVRDASGAGREGCVGCHTGSGFIDRINGETTPRTAYASINCQTCHEPHGETIPAEGSHFLLRTADSVTLKDGTVITEGGKGMLCMNCHQSRQNAAVYAATAAASSRFGPHHGPQADMLAGANGFTYGRSVPSSAHGYVVEDTCVGCHMQMVDAADPALTHAGGHTFKPSWDAGGGAPKRDLIAECQKCHGKSVTSFNFSLLDYDGDGQVEGVQTEVQHLLDQLALKLPPTGKAKTALTIDATWTRAQLKAAYNWQFVMDDGSKGIHNMAYTVGLLKASIADLK